MLSQLVYISVRKENCTDAEIDKILEASNRKNGEIDVTGVLLYSKTKFIQVLEGDKDEILNLYDKIKEDDRHRNVMFLSLRAIKKRDFPSWQMGRKEFDLNGVEFRTNISMSEQDQFKSILSGNGGEEINAVALINKFFK